MVSDTEKHLSIQRPVWRSNSWYDYNLVTAKGEKILSEIDDLAISELRKHKLIWSGFGPKWKKFSDKLSFG